MLVHRARDRTTTLLDFYVAIPGLGLGEERIADMESVDVVYAPESTQVFKIGAASCAVPGAPAGLEAAHRAYGSAPWARLIEPAIALARGGIDVTPEQAYLHGILDVLLRRTNEGRAIFEQGGTGLAAGDRLVMEDLARTLETLAESGAADLYSGTIARAIVSHLQEQGGAITAQDLAEYRTIRRRPVQVGYLGREFHSNPPPSSGGVLIGYGLLLLEALEAGGEPGSAEAMAALVEVMREQARARDGRFGRDLYRGGLAKRLHAAGAVREGLERIRARAPALEAPSPTRHDTHLCRRRAGQRRRANGLDRLRLRPDRSRDGHPPQQHAR